MSMRFLLLPLVIVVLVMFAAILVSMPPDVPGLSRL